MTEQDRSRSVGKKRRTQALHRELEQVCTWSMDGECNPVSIATGSNGMVFVCTGNQIHCFNHTGVLIRRFGSRGHDAGHFNDAHGIDVAWYDGCNSDVMRQVSGVPELSMYPPGLLPLLCSYLGEDYLVVADFGNKRIQVLRSDGVFQRQWNSWEDKVSGQRAEFKGPLQCRVAGDSVYVFELEEPTIRVFDIHSGKYIRQWEAVSRHYHIHGIALCRSVLYVRTSSGTECHCVVKWYGADDANVCAEHILHPPTREANVCAEHILHPPTREANSGAICLHEDATDCVCQVLCCFQDTLFIDSLKGLMQISRQGEVLTYWSLRESEWCKLQHISGDGIIYLTDRSRIYAARHAQTFY